MGRPSKLSENQWAEFLRRHLAGETIKALSVEFGVSASAAAGKISALATEIKCVAKQMVEADNRFRQLPVSAQLPTVTLVGELRAISEHLAGTAKLGAMTSRRLASMANEHSGKLDDAALLEPTSEEPAENASPEVRAAYAAEVQASRTNVTTLRTVVAYTEASNKAAATGLNLLAANKESVREAYAAGNVIDITPHMIPEDQEQASKAYQRLLGAP